MEDNKNLPALTPQDSQLPEDVSKLKAEMPKGIQNMLNKYFSPRAQEKILRVAEEIYNSMASQNEEPEPSPEPESIPLIEGYDGALESQIHHLDKHLYYERKNMHPEGLRLLKDISNSLKEYHLTRQLAEKRLKHAEE